MIKQEVVLPLDNPEFLFVPSSRELLIGRVATPDTVVVDYEATNDEELGEFVNLVTTPSVELPRRKFPRNRFADWQLDDYREYGKWLLPKVEPSLAEDLSHHVVLTRSYQLGAAPSRDRIMEKSRFGSVANFVRESGREPAIRYGRFDHFTFEDYVAHIENVIEEEGTSRITQDILWRRINENRYEEPSPAVIRASTGSLTAVLKAAGVRTKVQMTDTEHRLHALEYMAENGGQAPTVAVQNELARQGKAHHTSTITDRYGKWSIFKKEVEATFGKESRLTPGSTQQMKEEIESGEVPFSLLKGAATPSEIVQRYARYKIANSFLPEGVDSSLVVNASIPDQSDREFAQRLVRLGLAMPLDAVHNLIKSSGFYQDLAVAS